MTLMPFRKHMIMGATTLALAIVGGYFLPSKFGTNSNGNGFRNERLAVQGKPAAPDASKHHGTKPSGSALTNKWAPSAPSGLRKDPKRRMSIAVDPSFDVDEQKLREKVIETIELDSIADVPHQYDFWQNLGRDDFKKWEKAMSDLPENKAWFNERLRLMYEYSQARDANKKRQVIEELKRNQSERIRITELVISMAKAENPSIALPPRERPSASQSKQSGVQPSPATKPPEQPKVFQ